ncbi:MAG: hypothetical protein ACRDTZ_16340 [Pseudonocardiaceae bacterium]
MMRDDPRKMSDRQTLAEAVALAIEAIEADPEFDALDLHTGLWRAIHRTLPERWQTPALAGPPEEGRDWWHGVVGDHCLPYLEVGLDYAGVIEALRRAQADAVEHYS